MKQMAKARVTLEGEAHPIYGEVLDRLHDLMSTAYPGKVHKQVFDYESTAGKEDEAVEHTAQALEDFVWHKPIYGKGKPKKFLLQFEHSNKKGVLGSIVVYKPGVGHSPARAAEIIFRRPVGLAKLGRWVTFRRARDWPDVRVYDKDLADKLNLEDEAVQRELFAGQHAASDMPEEKRSAIEDILDNLDGEALVAKGLHHKLMLESLRSFVGGLDKMFISRFNDLTKAREIEDGETILVSSRDHEYNQSNGQLRTILTHPSILDPGFAYDDSASALLDSNNVLNHDDTRIRFKVRDGKVVGQVVEIYKPTPELRLWAKLMKQTYLKKWYGANHQIRVQDFSKVK